MGQHVDRVKEHIKGIAIRFCLGKQAERKTSCSLYTALACHLKSHIDAGRISFLEVYEKVLKMITALDRFEADGGARIRSRVLRWAEEGEMCISCVLRRSVAPRIGFPSCAALMAPLPRIFRSSF